MELRRVEPLTSSIACKDLLAATDDAGPADWALAEAAGAAALTLENIALQVDACDPDDPRQSGLSVNRVAPLEQMVEDLPALLAALLDAAEAAEAQATADEAAAQALPEGPDRAALLRRAAAGRRVAEAARSGHACLQRATRRSHDHPPPRHTACHRRPVSPPGHVVSTLPCRPTGPPLLVASAVTSIAG